MKVTRIKSTTRKYAMASISGPHVSGPDVPSLLAAPAGADRVIYTGAFSKSFATGVRAGYGVLPKPLFSAASRFKGNHDFGTSTLIQHILARAPAAGMYDRHLQVLHRRYAAKAGIMTLALREYFPAEAAWNEPQGGLYVWAKAPKPLTSGAKSKLFRAALERDVLYVPGQG